MTFEEFIDFYDKEATNPENYNLRRGQLLFTILREVRPDLSEKIRSTSLDPFYLDSSLPVCWLYLKNNWQNQGSQSLCWP
jgi:hypothetical protein